MPQCRNCDAHVTSRFARVFGDNGDQVHRCPDCSVDPDQYAGGSAGEESAAVSGHWR